MNSPITGYAEGFYGRLLSWFERRQIVDTLQRLGMTTYYYAPKEDPCHRLHWRTPYDETWREQFRRFCVYARGRGIRVVAGVAPGLDFDFAGLPDSADFVCLLQKCRALLDDGADVISLLMDDIDADFDNRSGRFNAEGEAHAALANALGDTLSESTVNSDEASSVISVWVTPRIYADELIAETPDYLSAFVSTLNEQHCVLYCGSDVVAHTLEADSADALRPDENVNSSQGLKHRVIIWDNLYANDYCPRRLFIGPWLRRASLKDVLLNPTGMVNTDCLLLALMAAAYDQPIESGSEEAGTDLSWQAVLQRHDVPHAFQVIAPFFYHPHFNSTNGTDAVMKAAMDNEAIRSAIEYCLWRWKTPLSREWYGYIFGLKHDLLTLANQHPTDRILKTQTPALAQALLKTNDKPD